MLSVPLPIVVASMLVMVMLANREALQSLPTGRWFLALLGVYCVVLVLIGIRWTSNSINVMPLLPVLAVCWCILSWIAFRSLGRAGAVIGAEDWPHLIPVLAVCLVLFASPVWLEVVIVASSLFYAHLLIRLARKGVDALRMVKFGAARNCHRAVWITGAALIYFAVIEVAIALDFGFFGGRHAAMIVTLANVPTIFILGLVAVGAGQAGSADESETSQSETPQSETPQSGATPAEPLQSSAIQPDPARTNASAAQSENEPDHAVLMQRLTSLLVDQALYADTELNLQRLARKAGVPAKQVSRAVNSQTDLNVSQWVNGARINAACELLRESDETILEVMDKVGFATKSNFNREFRRVTGTSPSGWRQS